MSGIKVNKKELLKSLKGPWAKLRSRVNELMELIVHYYNLLLESVPTGTTWDQHQLYYTAKALALYRLMTGEEPEIEFRENYVYLKGKNGEAYIPYKSIEYKGPFTRGYRYVKVNLEVQKYTIIKIKKKRTKKAKPKNEKLDKFLG